MTFINEQLQGTIGHMVQPDKGILAARAYHTIQQPVLQAWQDDAKNVVAAQCDWRIATHVQYAIRAGASRNDVIEAGFMAVVMHGGPALMYMPPLLEAIDEFLPQES